MLRWRHKECRDRHDQAAKRIPEFFLKALNSPLDADRFHTLVQEIAATSFIHDDELRTLAASGLSSMTETALDDGMLTQEEETRIATLAARFGVTSEDKVFHPAARRLKKVAILRDLDQGRAPNGATVTGTIGINLAKGESIIWLFDNVTAYKMRTKTSFQGRSQGMSFRIARGVYYRTGSFRGEPVKTQYMSEEGKGHLVLTTKAVMFSSPLRSLKLQAKKIIAIDPFSDGIALTRDGANPQPIIFKLDDPWFAANAIARLNQIED